MIKRKFRSDFLSKPITLPTSLQLSQLTLTKASQDSFPRIKRVTPSLQIETNHDSSFTRKQLIERAYTPMLPNSKKLFSSMNRSRSTSHLSSTQSTKRTLQTSQHEQQSQHVEQSSQSSQQPSKLQVTHTRKTSAQSQVRLINSSRSKDRIPIPQTPELKSLSKLVNYNLYKKNTQSNRQEHFDLNRNHTTNLAILKVKNFSVNEKKSIGNSNGAVDRFPQSTRNFSSSVQKAPTALNLKALSKNSQDQNTTQNIKQQILQVGLAKSTKTQRGELSSTRLKKQIYNSVTNSTQKGMHFRNDSVKELFVAQKHNKDSTFREAKRNHSEAKINTIPQN